MNDLATFKANAIERGICSMLDDWNGCNSKKQLLCLALSAKGVDYVAKATAEGWGLDAEYIAKEFSAFNNGRYVRNQNGYTSALYCAVEGEIVIHTTCALIIAHNGPIRVETPVCELYIANSDCEIVGKGKAVVTAYNSNVKQH